MIKRILILIAFGLIFSFNPVYCQTPKPTDTKSLLKKVTGLFDFKTHADVKKKRYLDSLLSRVNTAFNIPLLDSVKQINALTREQVKELIDTLSVAQKKNYTELLSTIERISTRIYIIDSVLSPDNPIVGIPTNDDQLNELAGLMTPILTKQVDEKGEQKQKNNYISNINAVITAGNLKETIFINDTLSKSIVHKVSKNGRLIGFYKYGSGDIKGNYLNVLDGVGYFPFGFKGKTGTLIGMNGWDSTAMYISAKTGGKEIIQTIKDSSEKNLNDLLFNKKNSSYLINQLVNNKTGSICLWFKYVNERNFYSFVEFVGALNMAFRNNSPDNRIYIRIAPYMKNSWYDLSLLNESVDYFMVDFSQPFMGGGVLPAAPLQGNKNNNIESCMSLYMQNVAAKKFILCLSYSGFIWKLNNKNASRPVLTHAIPYKDIMAKYAGRTLYDEEMVSAFIDTLDKRNNKTRIWFDDEYTLGKKYDYAVDNKLGGVAIWSIGDDDGYGELYNEMAYKFINASSDTIDICTKPQKVVLSFWQKEKIYAKLYIYMFNNPCEKCFESDKALLPLLFLIKEDRGGLILKLQKGIVFLSLFFLLLSLILTYFYIKNTIFSSRVWKVKKLVIAILSISVLLLIGCVVAALFTIGTVPYFGFIQDNETVGIEHCINMSFLTLITLVSIGILAGCIITKYLLFPLFKRDDVP